MKEHEQLACTVSDARSERCTETGKTASLGVIHSMLMANPSLALAKPIYTQGTKRRGEGVHL